MSNNFRELFQRNIQQEHSKTILNINIFVYSAHSSTLSFCSFSIDYREDFVRRTHYIVTMKVERVQLSNSKDVYVMTEKYVEIDDITSSIFSQSSQKSSDYDAAIIRAEMNRRLKLARQRTRNKRMLNIFPIPKWVRSSPGDIKPQPKISNSLQHVMKLHGDRLAKKYNFNVTETRVLVHIFWKISKGKMILTGEKLKLFFVTTFDCCERTPVFIRGYDRYSSQSVTVEEFVKLFAIIFRGTPEEKAKYVFEVYDLSGFGYLTRHDLIHLLKGCYSSSIGMSVLSDEEDKPFFETINYLMKKMDPHRTGRIFVKDFVNCVLKNPLLLECCCEVLPNDDYISLFKALLLVRF